MNSKLTESTLISLCADTDKLLSGSADKTIKIWSLHSGKCLRTVRGHKRTVKCLRLGLERTFASCGADYEVRVWSYAGNNDPHHPYRHIKCIFRLLGHGCAVTCFEIKGIEIMSGGGEYHSTHGCTFLSLPPSLPLSLRVSLISSYSRQRKRTES